MGLGDIGRLEEPMPSTLSELPATLEARWLGRVSYEEAYDLQRVIARSVESGCSPGRLLMLEHDPVYTMGLHADPASLLVSASVLSGRGAGVVNSDRGGDVTFHGPGQLVAYPIFRVGRFGARRWVSLLEAVVIAVAKEFGVEAAVEPKYPGVWVGDKKLCAIGIKVSHGVSMHGLALNVSTDLSNFESIVPCGIAGRGVTSLEALLGEHIPMEQVARALACAFSGELGIEHGEFFAAPWPRADVGDDEEPLAVEQAAWPDRRPRSADGTLRPDHVRAQARFDSGYRTVRSVVRGGEVNTVCEEARCPNIHECWADGTATFMILGDRCTRACGFCNVSTARPGEVDLGEAERVASAASALSLRHVVITSVARDDLADGGADAFARTIKSVREARPKSTVEVLIPDFKGDRRALECVIEAGPDVINHNIETVARLQRLVRPSAAYARSLAVLGRSLLIDPTISTKSGLMVGLGESNDEVVAAVADLAVVGVSILTVGQYLQPTRRHLPVRRWWSLPEFEELSNIASELGIAAVESAPLVRSSYRAHTSYGQAETMSRHAQVHV